MTTVFIVVVTAVTKHTGTPIMVSRNLIIARTVVREWRMVMRLIDADEVQKILDHIRGKYVDTYNRRTKVNQFFWDTIRYIEKKVRSIPTVEAKEVVHGEWIKLEGDWRSSNTNEPLTVHQCSICGAFFRNAPYNFCPKCGADMRGEKRE